jgi:hypothetical protein
MFELGKSQGRGISVSSSGRQLFQANADVKTEMVKVQSSGRWIYSKRVPKNSTAHKDR